MQWTFLKDDEEETNKFVSSVRAALDKIEQETATSDYETEAEQTDVSPSDEYESECFENWISFTYLTANRVHCFDSLSLISAAC